MRKHEHSLNLIQTTFAAMEYFFRDLYAFIAGCFIAFIGHLLPVKNILNLLILFFIFDVIFGYWAAKTTRSERFSVKIIWENTIPRMLTSIILICGAFLWDEAYGQELIPTYKIIGWFISGVLLYSIAQNGYEITKWSIFMKLSKAIEDKVKDNTGININEESNDN